MSFKVLSSCSLDTYIPRVGLLDRMIVLFLVVWGTSTLFSIVVIPIYILISNEQCSLSSTSLQILIFYLLDNNQSKCEVILWFLFSLWYTCPWWLVMLIFFHLSVDHLYVFTGKIPIQNFYPFLIGLFILLLLISMTSFSILDINLLSHV